MYTVHQIDKLFWYWFIKVNSYDVYQCWKNTYKKKWKNKINPNN